MPTTPMSFRKKAVAAVEMTAFAPGAGPPANRIATRRKLCCIRGGRAIVEGLLDSGISISAVYRVDPGHLTVFHFAGVAIAGLMASLETHFIK